MTVGADVPGPEVTLDRLLMLVGRINYVWANTESLLIHLIAGLCKIDKDRAVIIFLTLNTARARLDLVERLSKIDDVAVEQRDAILAVTRRMTKVSALRNRLNHSIYAFDPESGQAKTILMRISDRKDSLKIGRNDLVDLGAIAEIEQDIALIGQINADIWHIIRKFGYPA